jgi:hypothetical protein
MILFPERYLLLFDSVPIWELLSLRGLLSNCNHLWFCSRCDIFWFGPYRPGEIQAFESRCVIRSRCDILLWIQSLAGLPSPSRLTTIHCKSLAILFPDILLLIPYLKKQASRLTNDSPWHLAFGFSPYLRITKPRGWLLLPFTYDSCGSDIHLCFWIQSLPAEIIAFEATNDSVPERYLAFDSVPIWELLSLEADHTLCTHLWFRSRSDIYLAFWFSLYLQK